MTAACYSTCKQTGLVPCHMQTNWLGSRENLFLTRLLSLVIFVQDRKVRIISTMLLRRFSMVLQHKAERTSECRSHLVLLSTEAGAEWTTESGSDCKILKKAQGSWMLVHWMTGEACGNTMYLLDIVDVLGFFFSIVQQEHPAVSTVSECHNDVEQRS